MSRPESRCPHPSSSIVVPEPDQDRPERGIGESARSRASRRPRSRPPRTGRRCRPGRSRREFPVRIAPTRIRKRSQSAVDFAPSRSRCHVGFVDEVGQRRLAVLVIVDRQETSALRVEQEQSTEDQGQACASSSRRTASSATSRPAEAAHVPSAFADVGRMRADAIVHRGGRELGTLKCPCLFKEVCGKFPVSKVRRAKDRQERAVTLFKDAGASRPMYRVVADPTDASATRSRKRLPAASSPKAAPSASQSLTRAPSGGRPSLSRRAKSAAVGRGE